MGVERTALIWSIAVQNVSMRLCKAGFGVRRASARQRHLKLEGFALHINLLNVADKFWSASQAASYTII